jgi:hypothetical protein
MPQANIMFAFTVGTLKDWNLEPLELSKSLLAPFAWTHLPVGSIATTRCCIAQIFRCVTGSPTPASNPVTNLASPLVYCVPGVG